MADHPLFKQRNLSIDEKHRNLKSLIDTQLEFKTLADMSDLELAIMNTCNNDAEDAWTDIVYDQVL